MMYILSCAHSVTYLTFSDIESAVLAFERHKAKGYVGLCLSYGDDVIALHMGSV